MPGNLFEIQGNTRTTEKSKHFRVIKFLNSSLDAELRESPYSHLFNHNHLKLEIDDVISKINIGGEVGK